VGKLVIISWGITPCISATLTSKGVKVKNVFILNFWTGNRNTKETEEQDRRICTIFTITFNSFVQHYLFVKNFFIVFSVHDHICIYSITNGEVWRQEIVNPM
jgi:hypothetical protein